MIRKSLPFLMKNVTQTSIRPLSSFDLNRSSATSSTLLQSSFTPLNLPNRTLFGMKKDKLGGENSSKAKKQQQAEAEAKTQEEPMPEQGPPKAEEASASPEANNTASAESAETETASSEEVAALKLKIEEYEKELKTKDDVILKLKYGLGEERDASKRLRQVHERKMKFAHEKFCKDILTVYDNLSKGVEHSTANKSQELAPEVKTVVEGMEMTLKTLDGIFNRHHVTKIPCQVGDKFDEKLGQNAIALLPAGSIPDVEPGCVGVVQRGGFKLHDKILREADCIVIQED